MGNSGRWLSRVSLVSFLLAARILMNGSVWSGVSGLFSRKGKKEENIER